MNLITRKRKSKQLEKESAENRESNGDEQTFSSISLG